MILNVGILGAGRIAEKMARTVNVMDEARLLAVASREHARASDFAQRHSIKKAYGSYDALLDDPEIDLVYIATPHSCHRDHILKCLRAGKHVLCEKAFTCTAEEAREVCREADARGILLAEAMWTRYMPMVKTLQNFLAAQPIGEILNLTANLGYPVYGQKERVRRPELGGGALLDVGIYPLTFASLVMGDRIQSIAADAVFSDTGVDMQNSVILKYDKGRMASIASSVLTHTDRRGVIWCANGYAEVENINNFETFRIFDNSHRLLQTIERPLQLTGYEYEVRSAAKAIAEGRTECPEMPHKESIRMMELLDEIRHHLEYWFPGEKKEFFNEY